METFKTIIFVYGKTKTNKKATPLHAVKIWNGAAFVHALNQTYLGKYLPFPSSKTRYKTILLHWKNRGVIEFIFHRTQLGESVVFFQLIQCILHLLC